MNQVFRLAAALRATNQPSLMMVKHRLTATRPRKGAIVGGIRRTSSAATNASLSGPYEFFLLGAAAAGSLLALLSDEKKVTSAERAETSSVIEGDTRNETKPFRVKNVYEINQILGEGAFGRVFQAIRKTDGKPVALKTMPRTFTDTREWNREVAALRRLSGASSGGHENICQLYDTHVDAQNYYLVLELILGGELLEHLIHKGPFSEAEAATFLRQFAEALSFIHANGMIHADLKPENLMLNRPQDKVSVNISSQQQQQQRLKVVDFGCAVINKREEAGQENNPKEVLGTTAYWSPELFQDDGRPTPAADVWAAGCIVYILLTGSHPFDKNGDATDVGIEQEILRYAKNHDESIVFDERIEGLSASCVEMMKHMLDPDPNKRTTSDEFLRHPWTQGLTASWNTMADSQRKLEVFWQKRFRQEIIKKFASADGTLSEENLKLIFTSIDVNGDGELDLEEIRFVLKGLGVSEDAIPDIFASIDLDGSGTIDWDEFRTIMRKQFGDGPGVKIRYRQNRFQSNIFQKFRMGKDPGGDSLSEDTLRDIFHAIDLDGNGVLDGHEIRMVLRAVGEDEESISEMVAAIDIDHSGGVDWEEFRQIMFSKAEST